MDNGVYSTSPFPGDRQARNVNPPGPVVSNLYSAMPDSRLPLWVLAGIAVIVLLLTTD